MRILYSTNRFVLRRQALDEVRSLAAEWPDRRALLIVPEQTKLDTEREYLTLAGQPGLMMAEILSFRRLAWRLLGEIGQEPRLSVDSVGQSMLIHRALTRGKSQMHSFGHLADRPGFIQQAAAVLGDLKRYNIDSSQLSRAAEAAEDKALRDKTADLAVLLNEYDLARSETGLCDAEDDLNLLGRVLSELLRYQRQSVEPPWPLDRLSWLRDTSIWISGFGELRDFTPQEDIVLQTLDGLCRNLTLTITADFLPFDFQAAENGDECFMPGRKTAWRLLHLIPDCLTERVDDPLVSRAAGIAEDFRTGRSCRMAESQGQHTDWLQLIRASSLDDELAWVAGEIRRLVQLEGCRYRDITVAICDLPGYTPRLRAICREYGVPLFLDTDRPLRGTPLMRFVLGLLDLALHNWPQGTIMTCLRSGLSPLLAEEIDRLENYMLAYGISRPDRLFDDSRYSDPDLLICRDKAMKPWRNVLDIMRRSSSGPEKCSVLYQFLQNYGVAERLTQRSAALADTGDTDAAATMVQSWNELLRVLQQMTRLTGNSDMSLSVFRELLAAGLDAAGTNVIPTAIDQVTVGDLKRAMLRENKILMIVGASAESLPPRLPPEGLLKDQDRQALSAMIGRQLPSSLRDQAYADSFVIYSLFSLPADRLYVTTSSEAVSPWLTWLQAGNPQALQVIPPMPGWQDPRLNAVRPAFNYLLIKSGQRESLAEPEELGWFSVGRALRQAGQPLAEAADWLRWSSRPDIAQVQVPADSVLALYGGHPSLSVTQLERYAACPFQHLATHLLSLREREIWTPDTAETGTLLHGMIELAITELRQELAVLEPDDADGRRAVLERWLDGQKIERQVADWMAAAASRDHLQMFFDQGIQAAAGRRARRMATASLNAILRQYQDDAFRPAYLEWNFGPALRNSLALILPDGQRVEFRGKIDRVDLRHEPEGTYFRIIDYKSGDKKADYQALYYGLALQLPAYLEAFAESHTDCVAEDAAYFHLTRPILSLPAGARQDDAQILTALQKLYSLRGLKLTVDEVMLLRRHALKRAAELAGCLLKGDFEVAPRKLPKRELPCLYCPMLPVCGFDGNLAGCRWLKGPRCTRKADFIRLLREEAGDEGRAHDAAHT